MFDLIPVTSSNIKSIGWDHELSILYVEFKNGKMYAYKGVPEEVYADFIHSESAGKFFYAQIKGNFECEKVEKEEKD